MSWGRFMRRTVTAEISRYRLCVLTQYLCKKSSFTHNQVKVNALTFGAEQRGGALQELSDLLQCSLLPAVDAALGVVVTSRA